MWFFMVPRPEIDPGTGEAGRVPKTVPNGFKTNDMYIYIYLYDHPAGDKEVGGV